MIYKPSQKNTPLREEKKSAAADPQRCGTGSKENALLREEKSAAAGRLAGR